MQNLEEVWKREQEAAKEQQKLKELKKQIEEERAKEEMYTVAEAAGIRAKSDKLDWMYQGGVAARQEADQRQEAAVEKQQSQQQAVPAADTAVNLPSFYASENPASANEMWRRMHSDPLFAIKQRELAARKSIVANPVQMASIKQQVRERLDDRKHKTHNKKHKKKSRKDSDSEDDDDGRRHAKKKKKKKKRRSTSPSSQEAHATGRSLSSSSCRRNKDSDMLRSQNPGEGSKQGHNSGAADTGRYGITYGGRVPDAHRSADRSDAVNTTRRRLEEAERAHQAKEREAAARVEELRRRRPYKPGALNEEERLKKLEEMSSAAHSHDVGRAERLKEQYDKERREEREAFRGNHGERALKLGKEMYGVT